MMPREVLRGRHREIALRAGHRRERRLLVEHVVDDQVHVERLGHVVAQRAVEHPPRIDPEDVLGGRRVEIVELRAADEDALRVPGHRALRPDHLDGALAGQHVQLAVVIHRRRRADDRHELPHVEVLRLPGHLAEPVGQRGHPVDARLDALELEQARVHVPGLEVRDLAGGIAREGLAQRLVRIIGRVVAGVQHLRERQRFDRVVQQDVHVVHGDVQVRSPARMQHDAEGARIRRLAGQVRVAEFVPSAVALTTLDTKVEGLMPAAWQFFCRTAGSRPWFE